MGQMTSPGPSQQGYSVLLVCFQKSMYHLLRLCSLVVIRCGDANTPFFALFPVFFFFFRKLKSGKTWIVRDILGSVSMLSSSGFLRNFLEIPLPCNKENAWTFEVLKILNHIIIYYFVILFWPFTVELCLCYQQCLAGTHK